MVYASISQGAKGGGWDALHVSGDDLSNLEFEDEKIDAFELGVKTSLWDNRATINAAAFYNTIDNLQVSQFDGAVGFNVSNAAEATSQGVEIDARLAITERLVASVAIAYLDYTYDEYADAPCTQAQFNDYWLLNGNTAGCIQNMKNKPTVQAPEWSGSFSASYYLELAERSGLAVGRGHQLPRRPLPGGRPGPQHQTGKRMVNECTAGIATRVRAVAHCCHWQKSLGRKSVFV